MKFSSLLLGLTALGAGAFWAERDYRGWRSLGIGGIPPTPRGWLTVTKWRAKKKEAFGVALYEPDIGQPGNQTYLSPLATRNGPRPSIAPWPVPHRQRDQFIGTGMKQKLQDVFDDAVRRHGDAVHYAQSFYEKHSPAVTVRDPDCAHAHAQLGQGETAHIHPGDGSMHMIFSPGDAKTVIEAKWGERHPLCGVMATLPSTYLYVYPPRDDFELDIVKNLLGASIAHMTKAGAASAPQGSQ